MSENGREDTDRNMFSKKNRIILGIMLMIFSLSLLISFVSFLGSWKEDESVVEGLLDRELVTQNLLSKLGVGVSHFFIYQGFGLAAFIFIYLFFILGKYFFYGGSRSRLISRWFWSVFSILWVSLFLGIFWPDDAVFTGVIGYEMRSFIVDYIGLTGLVLLLLFWVCVYVFVRWRLTPSQVRDFFQKQPYKSSHQEEDVPFYENETKFSDEEEQYQEMNDFQINVGEEETVDVHNQGVIRTDEEESEDEIEIQIDKSVTEKTEASNLSEKLVADYGKFDPTLELSEYRFPVLELLEEHGSKDISVNKDELEKNKDKILQTLLNYSIEIAQIKATVGPTVTLYEIVPAAGIRISKIKNLEDDIALSLSALGIRIIAPIPGKGTIGIEVPNESPNIVSMHTAISSQKFQKSEMALPVALGKTISNETFVVDLAKMPHLLMAGATGQGKSVGLNAILTSIIYKKHPAEVKFVLVDPKKVELTLFNKIERHFLAKLPDSEEAIITDNTKVINTLNSLCIEMDNRYELLKDASVRNIKEYNTKFRNRRLNPENGHRYLPYIILVVDEFSDLIMTAGKEVETPIARLAQLARAIGIHLIIATQRPSVNVITGTIKANFPARIAFRVTSKIDSRTILDSQGADQLIGRGDLLFTQGNEITRVQCAFLDTPEVEKITDFIGSQRAYPEAYILPEYVGEETAVTDMDASDRDAMFREAAEIVVIAQQGSTSLIQRKLKIGYNRAGRIIDQLEAARIVGPFEGSKARQVLVSDLPSLENLLNLDKDI